MPEIIVLGAGISGLSAARALRTSGRDVVVFDQGTLPGGRLRSEQVGGFLMEHGANALAGPAPSAECLIAGLGLREEIVRYSAAVRHRYVVRAGCVRAMPVSAPRFLASGFVSLAGRLRLLMEPFAPARLGDETVAQFARRRLGREILDYVLDPLVGGLCAGDPEQLSVSAVFPWLRRLERDYGSVLLGALRSHASRANPSRAGVAAARGMFSFRQGLGALPQAMAHDLADRVFLGHRAESVQRRPGGGFRVQVRCGSVTQWATAESVIVALPAYGAAQVLAGLDGAIAQTLAAIPHPPIAVVFLGYGPGAIGHPLDGPGLLAPSVEKRGVLGMLFSSSLFPGRAPERHVALTAYVGGARQPQLAHLRPDELVALVAAEARSLLGAGAAPVLARSRCWRRGLPQQGVNHGQRLARLAEFESEQAGLFLTGNYLAGVSAASCIEQALRTAERAELDLAARRTPVRRAA